MSNSRKFLKKMYDIRVIDGNDGYLTKNAISNMIKKEHNIKLSPKDTKEILDELISDGLVEKTHNGLRISTLGMSSFNSKKSKPKSKTMKIVAIVIASALILATSLYFIYS